MIKQFYHNISVPIIWRISKMHFWIDYKAHNNIILYLITNNNNPINNCNRIVLYIIIMYNINNLFCYII